MCAKPQLDQVARRLKTALPSFGQERLWLVQQVTPKSAQYNQTSAVRVHGPLDLSLLERSVNEVVRRHDGLRTAFAVVKGRPVQVILRSLNVPLGVHDLRHLPPRERESEARRRLTEEACRPFDLTKAPLFRAAVIRLANDDHILAYTVHHIIGDAGAVGILNADIVLAYKDLALGQPFSFAFPQTTYAEFAQRQRNDLEGKRLEELQAYWEKKLSGLTPLELPTDRAGPPAPTFPGDIYLLRLPPELCRRLKEWGRSEGATPFTTLLAAVNMLLFRWTGQTDVAIATIVTARDRPELERVIGFFANTLVFRSDFSEDLTFRELAARTRASFLEDYAHADLPFEHLVKRLRPTRELSGVPLFNVTFALNPAPYDGIQRAAGAYTFNISEVPVHNRTSKLDLSFLCWQSGDAFTLALEYSTDLFDAATMERLAGQFTTLLTAALEDPDQSIRELPLLTPRERKQILYDWNATEFGPPHPATAHVRIEEFARTRPAAPAVEFEGCVLDYAELNRRANQLAHCLKRRGVGPGHIVGICLHRSLELIPAVLAVWKAGAAYVAIDPLYPSRRVAWMIEDCRPGLILAHSGIDSVQNHGVPVLELNESWSALASEDDTNPNIAVGAHDLAYICYTSGSTGLPKGAMVCHRGLANHCESVLQDRHYWDGRRVLMFMSLTFDGAVFQIAIALVTGGTLVIPGAEAVMPGPGLVDLMRAARINALVIPPSVLALLPEANLPDLATLAVAGEVCPASLVRRWAHGRTMLNLYGPTEATVWATIAVCQPDGSPPPIGRPVANFRCYVLDEHGQPVPIGTPGELYLGGPSICLGYLNQPELTAKRFLPDRFSKEPGARLYRTGDRCRWRADGSLEFLGRIDHQVKLLGFRIELGEIEAALQLHPGVKQACVLAQADAEQNVQLHAYLATGRGSQNGASGDALAAELREWLRSRLPWYMLPASFTVLDELPRNHSGKVDRAALAQRQPAFASPPPHEVELPATEVETRLARIWTELLRVEQVSVHDNFFELGGDSILAIQIAARASQEGLVLRPHQVFQHQTIAAQAAAVAEAGERGGAASLFSLEGLQQSGLETLLPLRSSGGKPPLFCVHHVAGLGLQYWDLVRSLPDDQPVYALQAAGLDGRSDPRTSVEKMAAHYVEQIRTVQPNGPYHVGGYSFGGIIAYEIAQQLTAGGSEVALLAVIDRPIPDSLLVAASHQPAPLDAEWSIGVIRLIETLWGVQIASPEEGLRPLSVDELLERIRQVARTEQGNGAAALRGLVEAAGEELLRNIFRVVEANLAASRAYAPRSYSGPITLFRAAERHPNMTQEFAEIYDDDFLGWRQLAEGPLSVHVVPGDHFSMIAPPHVEVLASKVQEAIDATAAPALAPGSEK